MATSDKFWLLIVIGKAALIATVGEFALVLSVLGFKIAVTPGEQQILKATVMFLLVFLPIGIAAWWIFQKLQARYTRREARAVATAFGVFTPVSLAVATVLSQLPGGYAASLGRSFSVVGVFVGVVVMTTLLSFLVCLFTLRMTRLIVRLESTN
jgi:hypothetical protein